MNFSPGREDMARRHCSKAGLLKKNKIIAGSDGSVFHSYPVSVWNENRSSCRSIVLMSSQCDANSTLVDEYDFVFVEMLVGRNLVSRRHLLGPDDQCLRSSARRIDLEDERLVTESIQRSPSSA